MNVCDTSFERAKTALLRGGDVLYRLYISSDGENQACL